MMASSSGAKRQLIIIMLLLATSVVLCQEFSLNNKQYYITPNPETSCPEEPCFTLEDIATETITTNSTMTFLPGNHSLNKDINIAYIGHLSIEGAVNSIILCTSPASIHFRSISYLQVSSVDIASCGSTSDALQIESVQHFELSSIKFRDGGSLSIQDSSGIMRVMEFKHSTTAGTKIAQSTVTLQGHNVFLHNSDGGVDSIDSTLNFSGTNLFMKNKASNGGGIAIRRSTINFKGHSTFWGNSAKRGGGVRAYTGSTICFNDGKTTFSNNSATLSGGAIYAERNSTIRINGETYFINNSASYSGGGVGVRNNCTLELRGESSFTQNSAQNSGGGIYVRDGSTVKLSGKSLFKNNSAQYYGGGIIADEGCTVVINGSSRFANNSAIFSGGGIRVSTNTVININGESSFSQNSAQYGGGINAYKGCTLLINGDNTFMNNSALYGGGGVRASQSCVIDINGKSSFISNAAGNNGGGIDAYNDCRINVSGSIRFINNSAQASGGGMNAGKHSLIGLKGNSSYIGNSAENHGGAISAYDNCTLAIDGICSFAENSARYDGGGICVQESSVAIIDGESQFNHNTARNGGGIGAYGTSTLAIIGVTHFFSNLANYDGGGIVGNKDCTVSINGKSRLTNNHAFRDGGGIAVYDNCDIIITGESTFIENLAHDDGGGISGFYYCAVSINGASRFVNNSALDDGGGISVYSACTVNTNGSIVVVSNSADYDGGGIRAVLNCTVRLSGDNYFSDNSAPYGGGIYVWKTRLDGYGNSVFVGNSAQFGGGGIYVMKESTAKLMGQSVFSNNWCQYHGGGAFISQSNFELSGVTNFKNNSGSYGGAVYAFFGRTVFRGDGNLKDNSATINGGALSLAGASKVYFAFNSSFNFIQNEAAQYGGAIFIEVTFQTFCIFEDLTHAHQIDDIIGFDCSDNPQPVGMKWTVEYENGICYVTPLDGAQPSIYPFFYLNFEENAAQAGSVLYGGDIDKTPVNVLFEPYDRNDEVITAGDIIDSLAVVKTASFTSTISSDPYHVCNCIEGQPDCSVPPTPHEVSIYPGQTLSISLVAVGQRNGPVPSSISSYYEPHKGARFKDLENTQKTGSTCTDLTYTIFSNRSSETVKLYADGPCGQSGIPLSVHVQLFDCPVGFVLSNSSLQCVCEQRLQNFTDRCHINNQTVTRTRSDSFWIGLTNKSDGIILHPHCPFDYCHTHDLNFKVNESNLQCKYNRSGLLCGECQEGLSLAFGSSKCLRCSNYYLSLIIAFALAGVILVILLLSLKLTVAIGTINGLIFYANIIAVNKEYFFPSGETNILTVFIAWVNLDLGIETCFFDGMDAYAKAWLQFVFPIYVWALVGVIVLLSHYSSRVSRSLGTNPIAVLATLFLLSYTKLLRTIITAFTFTFLEYPDRLKAVWLHDGNITLLSSKHLVFFIFALLALVFLFVPFTLLLLLGQWIQSQSERKCFSWSTDYRVKSILDVYHGPFKNEHRYWIGLLLVIRCLLYLIFTFNIQGNPSVNLLAIAVCALVLELWFKPYKNSYINALESSFIHNLGILSVTSLFIELTGAKQAALTYTSVGIASFTFCGIFFYHFYFQFKDSKIWKNLIEKVNSSVKKKPIDKVDGEGQEIKYAIAPTTTIVDITQPHA